MQRPIDNLENGMVLFGDDDKPRLSQWEIEYDRQDDDRDNQWFDENVRGKEDDRRGA